MSTADNLERQLMEIEALSSIFCQPGEGVEHLTPQLHTKLSAALDDDTLDQIAAELDASQQLSVRIAVALPDVATDDSNDDDDDDDDDAPFFCHLTCTMPHEYPASGVPELSVSVDELDRGTVSALKASLLELAREGDGAEVVLDLATALQDRATELISELLQQAAAAEAASAAQSAAAELALPRWKSTRPSRVYVYFHHLYSKSKRRHLLTGAAERGLHGFTLPGKPGCMVVEGPGTAVREFMSVVRGWSWKRLIERLVEWADDDDADGFYAFTRFEELNLGVHGHRRNHPNMGELKAFLAEHGLESKFAVLLGLD